MMMKMRYDYGGIGIIIVVIIWRLLVCDVGYLVLLLIIIISVD